MSLLQTIPIVLHGEPSTTRRLRAWDVAGLIILGGGIYGAAMGSFGGVGVDRWRQILFSAVKVPMLLSVSFALTLPSFFIINTLAGLRGDFRLSLRSVVTAQAGLAITLASLSPFAPLWYASNRDYATAILFNGLMFAVATFAGQLLLRRFYLQLIDRNPRHRVLLRIWTIVYAFVAIQMAWVLRPFIGGPSEPTFFFRQHAWGNAYVIVGNMVWSWIKRGV